jgi:hypothetical protein
MTFEKRAAHASPFDGIEQINPEFNPTIASQVAPYGPPHLGEQCEWSS